MAQDLRDRGGGEAAGRANGKQAVKRQESGITRGRKSLHLLRKIFHALAGVAMAAVYEVFLDRERTLMVFAAMFAALSLAETLRFCFPDSFFARLALQVTGALARTYEINHVSGMLYFVGGVLFVVGLYPKNVAVLSILFLSVGDPCASAFGIRFGYLGKKFSNGKTLIGYLGGVFACFMCTVAYYWGSHGGHAWQWQLVVVALVGGVAGATTELLCGRKLASDGSVSGGPIDIDDNLAVPIISGALFWAVLLNFPSFLEENKSLY